jgi:glycosyltransferase involved in cell wall biosynthesis
VSITVSVRLMTYNHAPFIQEAVKGILMQRTNFDVEVVVGDDFSRDNTLDIIKSFPNSNRVHFKILARQIGDEYWARRQELGRLYNFANILEHCSGKYIALLDGDDYWTDSLKLQKQVEFLEKNAGYAICFHNVYISEEGKMKRFHNTLIKDSFHTEDLFGDWFVPTSSVVLRRIENFKFPDWFFRSAHGDLSLLFVMSFYGELKYIDEIMGVYRQHSGGISKNLTAIGLLSTLSFVYVNIARDSDFRLMESANNSLARLTEQQVEMASRNLTFELASKIVRDIKFISERVSIKGLVCAIFLKFQRKLFGKKS